MNSEYMGYPEYREPFRYSFSILDFTENALRKVLPY